MTDKTQLNLNRILELSRTGFEAMAELTDLLERMGAVCDPPVQRGRIATAETDITQNSEEVMPWEEPEKAAPPVVMETEPQKPVKPSATLDDVRAVLTRLNAIGKAVEAKSIVNACGAVKLSEVDPSKYATIINAAEEVLKGA